MAQRDEMQERIEALEVENRQLRKRMTALWAWISRLEIKRVGEGMKSQQEVLEWIYPFTSLGANDEEADNGEED